jgi:hypothetical protein
VKELRENINHFNEIKIKIDNKDTKEIYNFCECIPINYKRKLAKIICFGELGYYFNEIDFDDVTKEVFQIIDNWVKQPMIEIGLGEYIVDSLKRNNKRIDHNFILELIFKIIEAPNKNNTITWRKILDLLSILDIRSLSLENRIKLIVFIDSFMANDNIRDSMYLPEIKRILIILSNSLKSETSKLRKNIEANLPEFYNCEYTIEVDPNDKVINEFIERKIKEMKNEKFGYENTFDLIVNLFLSNENVNSKLLIFAIEEAKNILLDNEQLPTTKYQALNMLISFLIHFKPLFGEKKDSFIQIFLNQTNVLNVFEHPLVLVSKFNIYFSYEALRYTYGEKNESKFIRLLSRVASLRDIDKINALNTVICIFGNSFCNLIDDKMLFLFLQFALGLSYEGNQEVRFLSIKLLLLLCNSKTQGIIINKLLDHINDDIYEIKNLILSNINKICNYSGPSKNGIEIHKSEKKC